MISWILIGSKKKKCDVGCETEKSIDKFYRPIKIKTKFIETVTNFEKLENLWNFCNFNNRIFTDNWMHSRQ
jgi:hypothetical protein